MGEHLGYLVSWEIFVRRYCRQISSRGITESRRGHLKCRHAQKNLTPSPTTAVVWRGSFPHTHRVLDATKHLNFGQSDRSEKRSHCSDLHFFNYDYLCLLTHFLSVKCPFHSPWPFLWWLLIVFAISLHKLFIPRGSSLHLHMFWNIFSRVGLASQFCLCCFGHVDV